MDLQNTEIAFKYRSNLELKKAQLIFKTFEHSFLTKTAPKALNFAMRLGLPVSPLVKATIFSQFCGGESVQDCTTTIRKLFKFGVGSILDYSVEGAQSDVEFDETFAELRRIVDLAAEEEGIPFVVFKATGMIRFGLLEKLANDERLTAIEEAEYERAIQRIDHICEYAVTRRVRIMIDAEESWIQDPIDVLATLQMQKHNQKSVFVYNTVQLYRHDRLQYVKQATENAIESGFKLGLKLVRGAYMEKERERAQEFGYEDPIQPSKQATDNAFDDALRHCVEHLEHVAICSGSHNEASAVLLAELMEKAGVTKSDKRVFFSQLYGMSDNLTFNLAHYGFNVCKYVPYGPVKSVIPYLIRRAEENTAVLGQTSRELLLIESEIRRRSGRS